MTVGLFLFCLFALSLEADIALQRRNGGTNKPFDEDDSIGSRDPIPKK